MTRLNKDEILDKVDYIIRVLDTGDLDLIRQDLNELRFYLDYSYIDNIKLPKSVYNDLVAFRQDKNVSIHDVLDICEYAETDKDDKLGLNHLTRVWINTSNVNKRKFLAAYLTGRYEELMTYNVFSKDKEYIIDVSGAYFKVCDKSEIDSHQTTRKVLEEKGIWRNTGFIIERADI